VLLEARRSLCPNTQKNKEKYGGEPDERLLPTKSYLSVRSPSHASLRDNENPGIRAVCKPSRTNHGCQPLANIH